MQNLIKLQSLEFEETTEKAVGVTIEELRGKVPPQILGHYDRLVAQGKKGVTSIRGEVCSGCHLRVPVGTIMTLKRGEDIQLCENCGRYLYLVETPKTESIPPAAPRRGRKPRVIKEEEHLV
ncbi:MAG TPA: C4-type zinc ribbon domain-containing protein [Verrucomicrobiae bacterium]|nr:C4-type zinc ribbon domain-containing protein [Verrucomicrobiae bacterium]